MSKKIVVIDDEPDVLEIVRAVLRTKGYEVHTANGGELGLEIADREKPDLIICDLMMPKVSGLEVIKRLRRNQRIRTTPVIILSAISADSERPPEFWIRSLGVDDFVVKPFDPLDLLGRVEFIFRRSTYKSAQTGDSAMRSEAASSAQANDTSMETRSPVDLGELSPQDVVRIFVESWNRQDFATEFNCLGEEMTGGLALHDYVARRRRCYMEEKGKDLIQVVARIVEEKVSLNMAKVVIDREDRAAGTPKKRQEAYSLKKTHRGWKIVNCRSVRV